MNKNQIKSLCERARRQALEEALLAAETIKNIPPESWEVSLVVRAIRELIDANRPK